MPVRADPHGRSDTREGQTLSSRPVVRVLQLQTPRRSASNPKSSPGLRENADCRAPVRTQLLPRRPASGPGDAMLREFRQDYLRLLCSTLVITASAHAAIAQTVEPGAGAATAEPAAQAPPP